MKKFSLLFFISILLTACDEREQKDFQSGILWQIESKNGKNSYIFGTLHIYPKTEIELSPKVISNLQKCKVLVIERKASSQSEQQFFEKFKVSGFVLERHEAIVSEYGDQLAGMELELMEKALQSKLTITGLETTRETLKILEQIQKLDHRKFNKEKVLTDYKEIIDLYKEGAIRKLYETSKKQIGEEMTRVILDKRNRNWIGDIEKLIQKDNTFIAVGAAHLGGENGILNLLTKEGYRITQVE